jgi:hypothetical protein
VADSSDRELLEAIIKMAGHHDLMLHQLVQALPTLHRLDQLAGRLEPLLERWGSFLGSPVRDFRAARKSARRGGDSGG